MMFGVQGYTKSTFGDKKLNFAKTAPLYEVELIKVLLIVKMAIKKPKIFTKSPFPIIIIIIIKKDHDTPIKTE